MGQGLSREKVLEAILTATREQFEPPATALSEATHFVNDLKADSLDLVELVMEIEDEFDIGIPDEEAGELQTIGQATNYVFKCLDTQRKQTYGVKE